MKFLKWINENILFVITLFFILFIPLYPKIPLLDIRNTWVYIRVEDFLVAACGVIFLFQWLRNKATIKTPLTIPIIIFFVIGGISTLHAIVFIFPVLYDLFPSLAILHYVRRIEYIMLFFIAFSAMKKKQYVTPVVVTLVITLLIVFVYGICQKLFGFPAFLTMNEEFAKGIPLRLSALARIPSTFAGHYDLAAYLVLVIPIIGSMIFAYRHLREKLILFFAAFCGFILLLLTASRVSFGVFILAISCMLVLQKQKKFIIPVIILSIFVLQFFQGISQRFTNTISQVDVVVDARTGKPVGVASENQLDTGIVVEDILSTGENLPRGSGYISLPGQQNSSTVRQISYIKSADNSGTQSAQVTNMEGNFVIKKVLAYDVSFTTRFQGEWPRAFNAFQRNIFLGSGYSSISLATDNDYIRMLGEVGILGFLAFVLIFVVYGIAVYRLIPKVDDIRVKSLVLGISAGLFGLGLNAVLIDVFEASKVAFTMWILIGV